MTDVAVLKPTVLIEEHRRLGAVIVPFAGYLMPIRYGSIIDEHRAVRERAGLFDLSHMGQIELSGPQALDDVDRLTTNLLSTMPVGKARYTLLTEHDGGTIDDLIVYHRENDILVVANAANAATVLAHLRANVSPTTVVKPRPDLALLAIQGPRAHYILAPLVNTELAHLKNYSAATVGTKFGNVFLARTGYTGEDGFEISIPGDRAVELFRALLEAGAAADLRPAGLAARDMLRLEAGMPLYGNELSRTITPLQAGLDWAVRFDKAHFTGKAALFHQRETLGSKIIGLRLHERIPARSGYPVYAQGTEIGIVCSATIAPSLGGASVATALVPVAHTEIGHTLEIGIRGTLYPATVVELPFYRRAR